MLQYDKLILDETAIDKLTKPDQEYLEKFTAIETLSMTGCKLHSLENFPKCPKLTRVRNKKSLTNEQIVLTDNFLNGNELSHLGGLKQITVLKLGGNKIKTLDDLKALVSLLCGLH